MISLYPSFLGCAAFFLGLFSASTDTLSSLVSRNALMALRVWSGLYLATLFLHFTSPDDVSYLYILWIGAALALLLCLNDVSLFLRAVILAIVLQLAQARLYDWFPFQHWHGLSTWWITCVIWVLGVELYSTNPREAACYLCTTLLWSAGLKVMAHDTEAAIALINPFWVSSTGMLFLFLIREALRSSGSSARELI